MEDVDLIALVAKDLLGKAIFAHVVPQKGWDRYHFAVDMLLRSDNEPIILKLLAHALSELHIAVQGSEQRFEDHPNSYQSSGNGEIAAAVKHVTGVIAAN